MPVSRWNCNQSQSPADPVNRQVVAERIALSLPVAEKKIWHRHPGLFLHGDQDVGYSDLKSGIRLLFGSRPAFVEPGLEK